LLRNISKPLGLGLILSLPKELKKDRRFGTWNVRSHYRVGDNIKMDLRETGIDGANWIRLAEDRVRWRAFVSTLMNLRVP
jgi:hypothetical protein